MVPAHDHAVPGRGGEARRSAASPAAWPKPSRPPGAEPVTAIYAAHYEALVRQAALLVRDHGTAEDVVQDVFAAVHSRGETPWDSGKELAYLRRGVINRAVSVLRHQTVIDRHARSAAAAEPSAEENALALLDESMLVAALNTLALRQRQVLVLRYYAGLSETETAAALGISQGAVKTHSARGRATLRAALRTASLPGSRTAGAQLHAGCALRERD